MQSLVLAVATALAAPAPAQPPDAAPDPQVLLMAESPQAAANKRLVYDFWREVLEGGHLEQAPRYLSEGYIQHNPNVPTGRDGFVAFFSHFTTPHAVAPTIEAPLVAITAEGDHVVVASVRTLPVPGATAKTYSTTWFDMFRIENGRIAEHWDSATLQQ